MLSWQRLAVVLLLLFSSAHALTNINACNYNITTGGETYNITQNLTSTMVDCIRISAANIVIRGNGFTITDGANISNDRAINFLSTGARVENLSISGFARDVAFSGGDRNFLGLINMTTLRGQCIFADSASDNNSIYNTTCIANGSGSMYALYHSRTSPAPPGSCWNLTYNNWRGNTSSGTLGIINMTCGNFSHNTFRCDYSSTADCLRFDYNTTNITLVNNTIIAAGGEWVELLRGPYFGSRNHTFIGNNFSGTGTFNFRDGNNSMNGTLNGENIGNTYAFTENSSLLYVHNGTKSSNFPNLGIMSSDQPCLNANFSQWNGTTQDCRVLTPYYGQFRWAGTATGANQTGEEVGEAEWSDPQNATGAPDSSPTQAQLNGLMTPPNSKYLAFYNYNFSLPSNATVLGMQARTCGNASQSGSNSISDYLIYPILAGTITATENMAQPGQWATALRWRTTRSANSTWSASPTYSDVNNAGFGYALSAVAGGSSNVWAKAYCGGMTVVFNETASSSNPCSCPGGADCVINLGLYCQINSSSQVTLPGYYLYYNGSGNITYFNSTSEIVVTARAVKWVNYSFVNENIRSTVRFNTSG